jgi:hypothetical protein
MAQLELIKPGDTLYSRERHNMGNTTIATSTVYEIHVVDVDPDGQWVEAHWNVKFNPKKRYYRHSVSKWLKNRPKDF